jgi:hypothetical protein
MEIGKSYIKNFFEDHGVKIFNFSGKETKSFRQKYKYSKTSDKSEDKFSAHCSDALALACEVGPGYRIEPGQLLVVDDTYRPVRRKLHKTQIYCGGSRLKYSHGHVFGLRKGLIIGTYRGRKGLLCGDYYGKYRYYNEQGNRLNATKISWVSSQFWGRLCA